MLLITRKSRPIVEQLLATKLYIPPTRPEFVARPRLIERLNAGLPRKLTLISAPAGFGKTTLVSEWLAGGERGEPLVRAAWLALDDGDNDPARFLAYFVAAVQTIEPEFGEGIYAALQSPQPPPIESVLTPLLNEIAAVTGNFVVVLDDYHAIDSGSIDQALAFLLEHQPPQMHLVIATREDPPLPLARLRARGQLTELRAADLRFTSAEAAEFLNQVMGLNLPEGDIAALETSTEGWIAGLQLAALALHGTNSMPGQPDAASFIKSFTGSHRFVLDFLVEEVLGQQPESVQIFLLCSSILDRLCGSLCDAVCSPGIAIAVDPSAPGQATAGQETLEYLERANLFIVPLDNERHWYRYHHLFADLLRQRLHQRAASSAGDEQQGVSELHRRASQWYEDNGLELEAFQHAAAAGDIERAERLIEGKGMPLHFRGAMAPVRHWLESLPAEALDARPSLLVKYAWAVMMSGSPGGVEPKLQAAEAALQGLEPDDKTRDLEGQIAALRALVATATQQPAETIIALSRRALELLHPDNLPVRTGTTFSLGIAYQLQGDRAAAGQAFNEVLSISQASGNFMFTVGAAISLGGIQETENQLRLAAETYRRILQMVGDPAHMAACEAHFGLARIRYEWNDLDAAEQHGQQSVQLVPQIECETSVPCEVLLARVKLARGDAAGAAAILTRAAGIAPPQNFPDPMPEVAAARVLVLLHQGSLAAAAQLAQMHELPISQVRVHLARGEASAALALLEPLRRQAQANDCPDEQLKVMVLQAVACFSHGDQGEAVRLVGEALALAEPGGFVRIFVNEGPPMAHLLSEAAAQGIMPDYIGKLLAAFEADAQQSEDKPELSPTRSRNELLSQRELEVLQLIAQGLSNHEISERLFLALDTVKGHNRRIFGKLQAQSRTEAVARARQLGLL